MGVDRKDRTSEGVHQHATSGLQPNPGQSAHEPLRLRSLHLSDDGKGRSVCFIPDLSQQRTQLGLLLSRETAALDQTRQRALRGIQGGEPTGVRPAERVIRAEVRLLSRLGGKEDEDEFVEGVVFVVMTRIAVGSLEQYGNPSQPSQAPVAPWLTAGTGHTAASEAATDLKTAAAIRGGTALPISLQATAICGENSYESGNEANLAASRTVRTRSS